ncbi:G-patch domain and KOW motifs-containing protein [Bactrocera neohumeralis]|uniref:G-patch domain and KOW motifs-containing protein n=1 Tax=Bactrocera tryoni TaxID=59916 RepID=UPI001A969E91|nr:G-patch domain and KOW motifs-containing protein [Bactrocera tryoni]XP_050327549.1 G-patch domain and KOW motifs-containing protein [Bactrocera neohumeralis]
MDSKKISFGFSKITKKSNLLPSNKDKEKQENKIELIKCLEGQEIKLLEEKKVDAPMVIPLKENTKTSAALASLMKRRAILLGEADELPPSGQTSHKNNDNNENHINETLDERAARELLASVQSKGNETIDQNLVLPALKADELPLDGAKQSTIDDYDNVPIEQFGKAMLRGMGWTEPIQKKGETPADEMLFVRPKGMGLGADKALKKQPLLVAPEKNEVLEIKKQAYVRILGGKHKDMYGQIEGFDDHAGRVIVKMAIGGGKEAFNEFLCQPISKKEFAQYGKCINTAKYEEYKKMENEHGQIIIKKEESHKKTLSLKDEIKGEYKNNSDNKHKSENKHGYKDDKSRNNDEISDKNSQKYKYDNDRERERFDQHSSSRRQRNDDRHSYHSNGNRVEGDRRRDGYRDSDFRHYELDEQRSSSSRRECYDDRRKNRGESKRRSRERSSRTEHEERHPSASSYSRRQQYTDDTSASSGTDSDSDSAYERKLKKKSSNHKSKPKKKSSKKSKRKQRHRTSDTETSSNSDSEDDEDASRREKKQHKKKTKKSKKPRSRSRSHDRTGRR